MIELIRKNTSYAGSYELKDEFISKKVHLVTIAQNGLTHLNVYAELWCGIPKMTVNQLVNMVNEKKETGSFYPIANISILPKSEKSNYPQVDNLPFTGSDLVKCLLDVFVVNNTLIKSEIVYFSLEPYYTNVTMIVNLLNDFIKDNRLNDSIVRKILISPL